MAFRRPHRSATIPVNLAPAWKEAAELLEIQTASTLSRFQRFTESGVSLLLALGTACCQYLLRPSSFPSRRELAVLSSKHLPESVNSDLDVEYLAKDTNSVQLRWMELSEEATRAAYG